MRTGSLLRGAGAIVLLGGMIWVSMLGAKEPGRSRSVRSREPTGRLGALALLDELGFDARAFELPPGSLPAESALCWLPHVPFDFDSRERSDAGVDLHTELGAERSPRAYRRFVAAGGTLVLAAGPGVGALLAEHLGIEGVRALAAPDESDMREIVIPWSDAQALSLEWPAADPLSELARAEGLEACFEDESGRVLALALPLEQGRVVLLAWDGFLDNERLAEADAATLLVRLVERLAPGGAILFDESVFGGWQPRSALEVAFGSQLGVLSVQLLLLLTCFAWRHTGVREFPRDPPPRAALTPLARARAIASLHLRARRPDQLARVLIAEVLRDIARGLHSAPHGSVAGAGDAAAEAAQEALARETLALVLERMGWGSERADLEQRIFAPVQSSADLERVNVALVELEERVKAAGASAGTGAVRALA